MKSKIDGAVWDWEAWEKVSGLPKKVLEAPQRIYQTKTGQRQGYSLLEISLEEYLVFNLNSNYNFELFTTHA